MNTTTTGPGGSSQQVVWFGQPRGLFTLFMTEMWERFTYYGMRAILVLFLVAAVQDGGLGLDDKTGTAVYGLYIAGTYLLSLVGGYIADRIIGAQRAVWWGGILIMVGNALLALGEKPYLLRRPHGHRFRCRTAQAEHQRGGGADLSGRRLAS